MELNKQIYLIIVIATLVWCLLLVLPPMLMSTSGNGKVFAQMEYKIFGHICHQLGERSFHIFGYKLAVCARCSGIYFGFLFGIFLIPVLRNVRTSKFKTVIVIIALPMLMDVSLDVLHIHESNLLTRFMTGFLFGFPSAVILFPSISEAINELLIFIERKKYYVRKT
jgi:uncharacterized membrane protein